MKSMIFIFLCFIQRISLLVVLGVWLGWIVPFVFSVQASETPFVETSTIEVSTPHKADKEWEASLISEYKNRLVLIQREIRELEENYEWLKAKIDRRLKMNQAVSGRLYGSLDYKKRRMDALKKDASVLSAFLARHTPKIQKKKPIAPKKKVNTSPCYSSIEDKIFQSGMKDWFDIVKKEDGVWVKTILPILFSSGSAVISDEYDPFLRKLAVFLRGQKIWIYVDGYTDTDAIRTPRFPSNFELGAFRAANVVHHLIRNGVAPSVFKLASSGQYRFPVDRQMSGEKVMERYVKITIHFYCNPNL